MQESRRLTQINADQKESAGRFGHYFYGWLISEFFAFVVESQAAHFGLWAEIQ
jgi:hypothetical protein